MGVFFTEKDNLELEKYVRVFFLLKKIVWSWRNKRGFSYRKKSSGLGEKSQLFA